MRVIGFLFPTSPETIVGRLRGFHRGLNETGYVEGENVSIVYRGADNQIDRLPTLAAELVRRPVAVIAAVNAASTLAAKAATTTIPIVLAVNEDPVNRGLIVANLARPEGNATGINFLSGELAATRMELLRELVPGAVHVAVLVNPANVTTTESTLRDVELAARSMGVQIQVLNASTSREIDAAFITLVRERPDALFVANNGFFTTRRDQLINLSSRHAIPATFSSREFAEAGGLISYGTSIADAWRQAGTYTGRVLEGAKPADLPVVQSSKFELVINLKAAKALGLEIPPTVLALADDVIE